MLPNPNDRLSLALCVAAIAHGFLLLGVGFTSDPPPVREENSQPLDVVLVQQRSLAPPAEADLLAQADLQGSGDLEAPNITPESPTLATFPAEEPELPTTVIPEEVLPEPDPPQPETVAAQQEAPAAEELLSQDAPGEHRPPDPEPQEPQPEGAQDKSNKLSRSRPDASLLIADSARVAALTAQIQRRLRKEASRPRRKFISASTQEYKYAAYMESWRTKVERFGNLNYPEEARRRRLSGSLILDVALNADGTLNNITLRRSSGHASLDQAAIRIVKLAAPYAPFPKEFRKELDILHITRTWQFLDEQGFR